MTLSVRSKLLLSSVLAVCVAALVGTAGWFGTESVRASMGEIVESSKRMRAELEADQLHDSLRGDVFAALFDSTRQSRGKEKAVQRAQQHAAELLERMKVARENAPHQVREAIEAAQASIEQYTQLAVAEVALAYDDHAAAAERSHEFMDAFRKVEGQMSKISEAFDRHREKTQQRGVEATTVAVQAMIAFGVTASILLVGLSALLARGILRRLGQGADAARKVAAGDLSQPIEAGANDEIGRLLRSLEKMRIDLAAAVAEIQGAARNVDSGSREIARGNADLSGRTEEQASSLEETASSMEEITATIKRNTDSARQATGLANEAADIAGRGGEAMRGVVVTMDGISDASRRIAEITGVIDGIAFQTNILALNAAVEAARAGEQGRGFAVVASEVRALAQRCGVAAKEIKGLIDDATRRVGDGTRQVDDAGKTMERIVGAVHGVNAIVREIAEASAEQLRGIEQVSHAVSQMDTVVQQNAALVEEAAAAAENLAGQAQSMAVTVGRFKLEEATFAAANEAQPRARAVPVAAAPQPLAAVPRLRAVPNAGAVVAEEWEQF